MGNVFSKSKTDPNDYEKILSELDASVQKAEFRLSEIKIRQRRTGVLWIIYSTLIWAVYSVYSFLTLEPDDDYQEILTTVAPILLIPFGIYYIRQGAAWYYTRKQKNEEVGLVALRAQQKLKVEELKKKTSYYTTKSLLERYDLAKKKDGEGNTDQLRQRKPASMPGTARQMPPHHAPGQPQLVQPPNSSIVTSPTASAPISSIPRSINQPARSAMPPQRQWYDKLVDALVGEDGPETKYALICSHCFAHNGLVLPQEIERIQYTCPVCKKFNRARQSFANPVKLPLSASPEPSPSLQHENSPQKEEEDKKEDSSARDEPLETVSAPVDPSISM
ncbi:hypothetical protein DFQ28_003651 [Apophysomyces sp. BC1034]|nr:hypothetical protein DFQ30_001824 [Apophysomyces sp. BC1015]KAG0182922.1 hypothetical protein DFQ29_001360 [Apophysomyces sp. BC1021]KAG0193731.1 hypothetical protein DFQ28_003651 [Apophysomyces sp. BC1034]